MSMWFYGDDKHGGECQLVCGQAQALEEEYLQIRVLLQETEAALRQAPDDAGLQAKRDDLRKRQADLESRARFADDYPPEFALGAAPYG